MAKAENSPKELGLATQRPRSMRLALDCMVQPNVPLDHISASYFEAMLGVSHEYARRLIVASERGTKDKSGYWLIDRTWAQKFALLRRHCRDHNKKVGNVGWLESAQRVEITLLSQGRSEQDTILESELGIIVHVFGALPLELGPEEASVFRTIEIFNSKRSGDTLRDSWTDRWADRIERFGIISIQRVEFDRGSGG
jgi:hypothetical protein